MSMTSADEFVAKMQKDRDFRNTICEIQSEEALRKTLHEHGFSFQLKDLINAMSSCMETMDRGCNA